MAQIKQITPFVMTHDLDASVSFFEDALGFVCGCRMSNYAFLRCEGCAIRVVEVDATCEIGEQLIYVDCDDVDGVYTAMKNKLDKLPSDRVRAPFDQPYAMREFHVKDPDNCLLLFGMDIPSAD